MCVCNTTACAREFIALERRAQTNNNTIILALCLLLLFGRVNPFGRTNVRREEDFTWFRVNRHPLVSLFY